MRVLERRFYERDPAMVAQDLLGTILVRTLESKALSGRIVETEAYYGAGDPASRAYRGRKKFNELMYGAPGRAFIYMVHANWLLNVVAHLRGEVGAVLIRAIEPIQGIAVMSDNRRVGDFRSLTNGPGKLTQALAITKELNGVDVIGRDGELTVMEGEERGFEIASSHRIGVRRDLLQELRFFIKGSNFVSKTSETQMMKNRAGMHLS